MASTGTQQALGNGLQQSAAPNVTSRRRWADLGLVLLVGVAPLVASSIYELFSPMASTRSSTNLSFSIGLVQDAGVLILSFTLLKRQGRSLRDIGFGFSRFDLPRAIGLYILSYVALTVVSATVRYMHFFWTGSYLQFRDPKTIFAGASPTLILLYAIAAPIFEETLIRGYLMTELIGLSWPVWLATIASFVVQGSYHLYYGFAGALVVSAGFAILAIYFAISRRLLPVILAHFFWDLTAAYMNWHR